MVTCENSPSGLPHIKGGGGIPQTFGNNPEPPLGIAVEAGENASRLVNKASISGGGAAVPASTHNTVTVGPAPAVTGITGWDSWISNADGTIDTQAGSHPYEITTIFNLATSLNANLEGELTGSEIRNLEVQLPPGLVGDLRAAPQCTRTQFLLGENGACPQATEVGTLGAETFGPTIIDPVYNMVPRPGVPAEFGFKFGGVSVYITFGVRSGGDYGITAHVTNLAQREAVQGIVTIWGTPGERSHDPWRGARPRGCTQEELEHSPPNGEEESLCTSPQHPLLTPILTLPTSCGEPQTILIRELSGWQDPNAKSEMSSAFHDASDTPGGFTGCADLAFGPAISTTLGTARADSPTGLAIGVTPSLGGLEESNALGSSDIENTTVTLPPGVVINPGQAAGLQACTPAEAALENLPGGVENDGPAACPPASKVATATINSPLIESAGEKQIDGEVYVLQSNPPEVKLLIAASADGVNVKLVGVAHLNEETGQVTTTFDGTPQIPISHLKLVFPEGPKAALDTPTQCGVGGTTAEFTPWSSPALETFSTGASFAITEGANGSACPSGALPFSPSLVAGSDSTQAGGYTNLETQISRDDGQQRIEKLRLTLPKGLLAIISKVPLCAESAANLGTCSSQSQIGHATVTAGPGQYPLSIPQPGKPEVPVYLTGPYKGAPFGLSIVTRALAGPFDLGTIVTRASVEVDPATAQVTINTDPLPAIVKGVPTDLRQINVTIDRPNFGLAPTNCSAMAFSGTASGTMPPGAAGAGSTAPLESRFKVGGCKELAFTPKVTVSTAAHASRATGASLSFKIAYPKGAVGKQAWFAAAKFDIPKQLPARNTTLQKACLASVFASNRVACPKASMVGHARVHTPVLPVPLEGSVYLVSHGGAKFPDAVMVLQGDNVTVELTGETFINKTTGVTSVTFRRTPDVPFEALEVTLPTGQFSEFGAFLPHGSYNFCGRKLKIPNVLVGQNGLEIHQSTTIAVTNCRKTSKKKPAAKKKSEG